MPIPVKCGACQAQMKAPDHLAGKRVKCAKCGQPLAVPAASQAVAATPPAAKAPQAPRRQAAPKVQLPLLSFEDLKVPKRLRRSIEEEIGEEQIVWMGRPTPQSLYSKAKIGMLAGLVISILVIVGMVYVLMQSSEGMTPLIVGGIGGLVLLTLGLPLATMPIWVRWLVNYRDCYVLTQARAIVFDNEQIVKAYAKAFTAEELDDREVRVYEDGTGSIIFGSETIDLGTRTSMKTRDEKRHGKKVRVTYIKTKREKASKGVGFMDIEDVERVEALLRQTLNLNSPGAEEIG